MHCKFPTDLYAWVLGYHVSYTDEGFQFFTPEILDKQIQTWGVSVYSVSTLSELFLSCRYIKVPVSFILLILIYIAVMFIQSPCIILTRSRSLL